MSKRYLIAVLALALLLAASAAQAAPANATVITANHSYTATVAAGETVYFSFKPTVSATYTFYSEGTDDTYGYLYNADMGELGHDDDNGDGSNFGISQWLTAGTQYYYGARYYNANKFGQFGVRLVKSNNLSIRAVSSAWPDTNTLNEVISMVAEASCDSGSMTFEWRDAEGNIITNGVTSTADTSTLRMAIPAAQNLRYTCTVTDDFDTTQSVSFNPRFRNGFEVTTNGKSELYTAAGCPVSLRVDGHCNVGALRYQWYGDDGLIEGATSSYYIVPSVTGNAEYTCRVNDSYGNTGSVYFYVGVDNGFYIYDSGDGQAVAPGARVPITVQAYVDEGDLTYKWRYQTNDDETELDATGPTLTTGPINELCWYICEITDMYGNTRYAVYSFTVDNSLTVQEDEYGEIVVPYGSDYTVTVHASCSRGALSYEWVYFDGTNQFGDWPNAASITLEDVAHGGEVVVTVTDQYGNSRSVNWSVIVDSGLTVQAATDTTVVAQPGTTVTMGVTASANHGTLTYRWRGNGVGVDGNNATTPTLTITAGASGTRYVCEVTDGLGNWEYVEFYVLTEAAEALTLDRPVTFTAAGAHAIKKYTFRPTTTGAYTLQSSNSTNDPYVTLFDGDDEIDHADDELEEMNFRLSRTLTANRTYTFIVGAYNQGTASIVLTAGSSDMALPEAETERNLTLRVGQRVRFPVSNYDPEIDNYVLSASNVLTRSGDRFTAAKAGTVDLYVLNSDYYGDDEESFWTVWHVTVVSGAKVITAPSRLTAIGDEAFAGDTAARFVALGSGVTLVSANAFADSGVVQISVTGPLTRFMGGSLSGVDAVVLCPEGSLTEAYLVQYGYAYAYND